MKNYNIINIIKNILLVSGRMRPSCGHHIQLVTPGLQVCTAVHLITILHKIYKALRKILLKNNCINTNFLYKIKLTILKFTNKEIFQVNILQLFFNLFVNLTDCLTNIQTQNTDKNYRFYLHFRIHSKKYFQNITQLVYRCKNGILIYHINIFEFVIRLWFY